MVFGEGSSDDILEDELINDFEFMLINILFSKLIKSILRNGNRFL